MENNLLEKRLEKIENLLLGQKDVFTFDECCGYTGISKTYMYNLRFVPPKKEINFVKDY
ncbi:hypothetical protein EZS27_011127 [termite gut metagenome]|uniref:Uncharacterized protein n=1 Tax=termite gut metagenome TaxID=433724 RepID=A0A5J4S4R5_9ZZZZ